MNRLSAQYDGIARTLHWLIVLMIVVQFLLGWIMPDIHRATAAFSVAGKNYPAGSYVVKTAQAFRPHVLDMFEPQDHPNDFRYPGGPPVPRGVSGLRLNPTRA